MFRPLYSFVNMSPYPLSPLSAQFFTSIHKPSTHFLSNFKIVFTNEPRQVTDQTGLLLNLLPCGLRPLLSPSTIVVVSECRGLLTLPDHIHIHPSKAHVTSSKYVKKSASVGPFKDKPKEHQNALGQLPVFHRPIRFNCQRIFLRLITHSPSVSSASHRLDQIPGSLHRSLALFQAHR